MEIYQREVDPCSYKWKVPDRGLCRAVTVAGLHSAGFAVKCPVGTSTKEDPTEAEYFRGEARTEEAAEESEDRAEEEEDVEESEDGSEEEEDAERSDDGEEPQEEAGTEEDAEEIEEGAEEEKDTERSDAGEELQEKARTKGDEGPEAEADKEQCREEPTSRTPRHVPGGTWLHKVRAYLRKIVPTELRGHEGREGEPRGGT
ncbi:hypothetical protein NDU88_000221 [Pleurodeles waltl]|uniref:Uncharacterized protein n=1 Tax=Pleurodeles waltl TaxID=8319 RepID=A0AAV7V7S4_PLEWA|nr:hypothetical protein NDU88_000221 [Pleurodeles waltl]